MESNSLESKSSNNATQNSPQNHKHHPITLEKITLINIIGLNKQGEKVTRKKLQFQGIVKMVQDNKKEIHVRKIAMTGKRLTLNQKLAEMCIELDCSLTTAKSCTFEGKIHIKEAKVFEVARQVQISKKFETVKNVTRKAVRFMQYFHVKRNIKVFQIIAFF